MISGFSPARKSLLAGVALVVGMPATLCATEIQLQSDTLFRGMKRAVGGGAREQTVAPGYEYLQIDIGRPLTKGFSAHGYGWGRYDFADNGFFAEQGEGELLYGYLQYVDPASGFDLRAGRQNVFAGVGNEAMDGVQISGNLGAGFVATAYGGQSVGYASSNNRDGDSTHGGRLGYQKLKYGEVGVSYKNLENDDLSVEKTVGFDLALFLPGKVSAFGLSTRNLDTESWAEHSYELRVPYQLVNFRPYFGQFAYEHYFGTGVNTVNPFRVLAINGEELRVLGLDTIWKYSEEVELGIKVKGNDYDRMNGSQYASGLVTWHGEELTRIGMEIGYMHGDLDRQKYLLSRLFGYWDGLAGLGGGFLSADLLWARYAEEIFGRDNSLFVSLGVGRSFLDKALELKLSGDYSRDPFFDSEVRGLLVLTYRFKHAL